MNASRRPRAGSSTSVLLPGWMAWGFADYLCHRSSEIENTSGTHESLTHGLMIATTGAGIVTAMFCEVNGLVLLIIAASTFAHEAVVLWDVGYAAKTRPPSPTEQHIHSFRSAALYRARGVVVLELGGRRRVVRSCEARASSFASRPKREPRSLLYNAAIIALVTVTLVIPYTEEFIRCWRVDRTLLPHRA